MGLARYCRSDPLLDFIRDTYGAVPLRMPDARWAPFALFELSGRNVRYLGSAIDVGRDAEPPAVTRTALAGLESHRSSQVSWDHAVEIASPFLATLVGLPLPDLEIGLSNAVDRKAQVCLSLGRAVRRAVTVLALARWLDEGHLQLPTTLGLAGRVFVVDSVLYSREFTTVVDRSADTDLTSRIAASLVGSVDPKLVLRSSSKVTVRGRGDTPFAFTCVELDRGPDGVITGMRLDTPGPRAAATAVGGAGLSGHELVSAPEELVQFDA